jgi:hypothetical protein
MNGTSSVKRDNQISSTLNATNGATQSKNIMDEITDIFGTSSINPKQPNNDLNIFGTIDLTTSSKTIENNISNVNNNAENTGVPKTNTNDLLSTLGAVSYKTNYF